jgi:hypothetical protein
MNIRRALITPAVAALAAIAIACGGGDGEKETASNAPSSGGSAAGTAQFVDLRASTSKLEDLKSFRYDFAMKLDFGALPSGGSKPEDALGEAFAAAFLGALSDIKAEGSFVAPNQTEGKVRFGGEEIAYVQIGDKAWVKMGSSWEPTSASSDFASGITSSPTDLFQDLLPMEVLRGAKTSQESVNGVKATKYSFDKQALESLVKQFGEDTADFEDVDTAKFDIWLNEGSIPVKILMEIAGKSDAGQKMSVRLELNVRDINSDSIKIRPPA